MKNELHEASEETWKLTVGRRKAEAKEPRVWDTAGVLV